MMIKNKISTRGYARYTFHPVLFDAEGLSYDQLEAVIKKSQVALRGWYFPHIDLHEPIIYKKDYIEQESAYGPHQESWRFHQSYLFTSVVSFREDWPEIKDPFFDQYPDSRGRERLDVIQMTLQVFEFAELCSRLAEHTGKLQDYIIKISWNGVKNRYLNINDPSMMNFFHTDCRFGEDSLTTEHRITHAALLASPRQLAAEWLRKMFQRFKWPAQSEVFMNIAARNLRRH